MTQLDGRAVIVTGCVLAYLAVGLFAARWAFGLMRAKSIDGNMKKYPSLYRTTDKAISEWRGVDSVPAAMVAFLVLVGWPVAMLVGFAGGWFWRFLSGTARLSQAEYQERLATRDRRIKELEQEAGIS